MIPDPVFEAAHAAAMERIARRYGLAVVVKQMPEPYIGDIDGETIFVDPDPSSEEDLFLLVHLFGHSVQWNSDPVARGLGLLEVRDPSESLLAELEQYERTAARYSLQLLHEIGVRDLDQWLSDFAACDVAYLMHFYRTGEKRPMRSFWISPSPVIVPLEVPAFQPQRWASRTGVVI